MSEKKSGAEEPVAEDIPRAGFLGVMGLCRALRNRQFLFPGQGFAKATQGMKAAESTAGEVAEAAEAGPNDAPVERVEPDLGTDSGLLDFEWEGDFPDKSLGFIAPDYPSSPYQNRAG